VAFHYLQIKHIELIIYYGMNVKNNTRGNSMKKIKLRISVTLNVVFILFCFFVLMQLEGATNILHKITGGSGIIEFTSHYYDREICI
jgi:hypothetical protein